MKMFVAALIYVIDLEKDLSYILHRIMESVAFA